SVGKGAAEPGVEGAAETVAVGEEHDDRDDSPGDAEHRQRCTEPVVIEPERRFAHDLAQGLGEAHVHISKRSASTGGSSAARRAGYEEVRMPIVVSVRSDSAAACHDRIIPAKRSG